MREENRAWSCWVSLDYLEAGGKVEWRTGGLVRWLLGRTNFGPTDPRLRSRGPMGVSRLSGSLPVFTPPEVGGTMALGEVTSRLAHIQLGDILRTDVATTYSTSQSKPKTRVPVTHVLSVLLHEDRQSLVRLPTFSLPVLPLHWFRDVPSHRHPLGRRRGYRNFCCSVAFHGCRSVFVFQGSLTS